MSKVNTRHKMAAAKAAAHLPKGYLGVSGNAAQEGYLAAISKYGDHADAAASILHDCAMANLQDSNRRGGPQAVIADLSRMMEFVTGENKTGKSLANLGVVTVTPKEDAQEVTQEINVVT